jgi:hypothetical protein
LIISRVFRGVKDRISVKSGLLCEPFLGLPRGEVGRPAKCESKVSTAEAALAVRKR